MTEVAIRVKGILNLLTKSHDPPCSVVIVCRINYAINYISLFHMYEPPVSWGPVRTSRV